MFRDEEVEGTIFWEGNNLLADPVAARSEARSLSARTLDRGFESRLRHGCLSSSVYVVLFCVGRGHATSWSLVQGVLPSVNDLHRSNPQEKNLLLTMK
jgi:hypothetical protein